MKRTKHASPRRRMLVLVLALVLDVAACASHSHTQAQPVRAEVDAIKDLMVQTTDAFNRHDAKAWAQSCTPDAQLVTVRGESMKGVAAIERGLAVIFATRGQAARLTTLDITVRFVRPDVALVHVTNEISGVTAPDGRSLPSHRELSLRVVTKEHGVWRISAFHNTIVQP